MEKIHQLVSSSNTNFELETAKPEFRRSKFWKFCNRRVPGYLFCKTEESRYLNIYFVREDKAGTWIFILYERTREVPGNLFCTRGQGRYLDIYSVRGDKAGTWIFILYEKTRQVPGHLFCKQNKTGTRILTKTLINIRHAQLFNVYESRTH